MCFVRECDACGSVSFVFVAFCFCVLLLLLLVVLLVVLEFENGSREEELLLFSVVVPIRSSLHALVAVAAISYFQHLFVLKPQLQN